MHHVLAIKPEFADAIVDGRKTFEVRRTYRNIKEGDTVSFEVEDVTPEQAANHPISDRIYRVLYTLCGWGINSDHMAFSICEDE